MSTPLLDQCYPARPEMLAQVRSDLRQACLAANVPEQYAGDLILAVNEACMNIIQHAYRGSPRPDQERIFVVRLQHDGGALIVHLLDRGCPVSESDLKPRALEDLRPGGLGVRLIRELTDDMKYLPAPESFANLLELRKNLS
jgi:sigma-B regulation protein RsbU (phosphoserine phosphatase)